MTGLLVAGTSSDAGKSLVVTGLCRVAARRGLRVAPFKAQNMSNNSMVCSDGSEIGRAQYLQAAAAGIAPTSAMNPVLLKPGSDRRSSIVLRGQPFGTLESGQYTTGRRALAESAWAAYRELAAEYDLIICEGAGSPAEINLRSGDYTNMGLAREMQLPVVLVGDIDRGGVLASIYGTWGLLDGGDRALLAGYLINKFRGDADILEPGLVELTRRTGLASFGVLPWLPGAWLDGEDSLELGRWRGEPGRVGSLQIAMVRLPRTTNSTDVDALAHEAGVDVQITTDPQVCAAADLLILPGSRSLDDYSGWLAEQGITEAIATRAAHGRPVLAISEGCQLLGVDGLDLLPMAFGGQPELPRQLVGHWRGHEVRGYQLHRLGVELLSPGDEAFPGGLRAGQVWATMWHGAFESDGFRRAFLAEIAHTVGSRWQAQAQPGFSAAREAMIESVADALEEHCRVDSLLSLAR